MNDYSKIWRVLLISICFLTLSSYVRAAEDNPLADIISNPDNGVRCVSLSAIDHTDIVDNGFILFYMRGKKIYLNVLPRTCHGLKNADSFMYRVPTMRLCNVDLITVLERVGGGFYPGPTCGLGLFFPVNKKIAKDITHRSK